MTSAPSRSDTPYHAGKAESFVKDLKEKRSWFGGGVSDDKIDDEQYKMARDKSKRLRKQALP